MTLFRTPAPAPLRAIDPVTAIAESAAGSDFLGALRQSRLVADIVARDPAPDRVLPALVDLLDGAPLQVMMAAESLGRTMLPSAADALAGLLTHPHPIVRRHAAWHLGNATPLRVAVPLLIEQLTSGGMDTLHAHRTLRNWASALPAPLVFAVLDALHAEHDPARRVRLVDLLGVLPREATCGILASVADDVDEHPSTRIAAIAPLGECGDTHSAAVLRRLATGSDDEIGVHARLALDLRTNRRGSDPDKKRGLRIAQIVLAGELDGQLSRGGRGDTGGVASLLVSLSEALTRQPEVDRVLTIGRGSATDALVDDLSLAGAETFATIALDLDRPGDARDKIWELLPSVERGLRRALRGTHCDVVHLRMADVATLAGHRVAHQLGVPICFSVAPDPHHVIESHQAAGRLDHDAFLALESEQSLFFRARMVEDLTANSEMLALFPRGGGERIPQILSMDSGPRTSRCEVVPEGIDVGSVGRATRAIRRLHEGGETPEVVRDLVALIPEDRRGLPLLVTVGRFHPVKGVDRVVDAWASDPLLRQSCTLVVIGGDLNRPSPTERAVLDRIELLVPADDPSAEGLVLLGGRPRSDVAAVLAVAEAGLPGFIAPGGVYVDGAVKEEFGLAVLEALAAGLAVVAPRTGGPVTYVADGETGVLVDPAGSLADAAHRAFDLVEMPGRADRARALVNERYSIDAMARRLVDLYQPAGEFR